MEIMFWCCKACERFVYAGTLCPQCGKLPPSTLGGTPVGVAIRPEEA